MLRAMQQRYWAAIEGALKVDRIPFAKLAEERLKMLRRLELQTVRDAALHQRATAELADRLDNWWGGALRPLTPFSEMPPPTGPVSTPADPMELLIVRAIGSIGEAVAFGVAPDGGVFVTNTGSWTDGRAVFVAGISSLLDQATDIFSQLTDGTGGRFVERDGRFFADTAVHDNARAFLLVESNHKTAGPTGLWRRIVSVFKGLWDDNDQEPNKTATGPPDTSEPQRFRLVVDFNVGEWPTLES